MLHLQKYFMSNFCLFLVGLLFSAQSFSQNVGIGSTDLTKAKLSVVGTASVNSSTVGIFGLNGGISLQQAWPTIGFNQYRAQPTGNGTAISTGYGMHMTFNYNNGDFVMYRNGWASEGGAVQSTGGNNGLYRKWI
jgi:hypothetical protein